MTGPSYANVLSDARNQDARSGGKRAPNLEQQIEELSSPRPEAMTLNAALQLLSPLSMQHDVFLMTRSYLQNWLIWAYHQKVSKLESARVEVALRMAATKFALLPPTMDMEYNDPGPIDVSILCMDENPLLLKPNVVAMDGMPESMQDSMRSMETMRRVKSLPPEYENDPANSQSSDDAPNKLDVRDGNILCCAVSENFYETLRKTHGVLCVGDFDVSFQAYTSDSSSLLHHQSSDIAPAQNGRDVTRQSHSSRSRPRPLEFRRRVVLAPQVIIKRQGNDISSPMTKLLQEERKLTQPKMILKVEVHPVTIMYEVLDVDCASQKAPKNGMVLVSARTNTTRALQELLKVAAPKTSSNCKRVWSKRINSTATGDGYELVNVKSLDGRLRTKNQSGHSELLVEEWLRTLYDSSRNREIRLRIETRRPKDAWPRKALELENRIQVGDFVDAQDETGKWYESLVREVNDGAVKVHYMGWASRWDTWVHRQNDGPAPQGVNPKLNPPAPLWSRAQRWRYRLTEGMVVEVRDTSSRPDRPKWYKGIVRGFRSSNVPSKKPPLGAKLEVYDDSGNEVNPAKAKPLVLMGRKDEVLVFVEEELKDALEFAAAVIDPTADDAVGQDHPSLRWVALYGEEICEAGTHIKISARDDSVVATLRYEYDAGRKPVEIMKSYNNMYGAGFVKESLRGIPPAPGSVGLHNLGNSCFLNSIIQCLNQIAPLTNYFLKGAYLDDLNRENPLGSGGHVATAYSSLLHEMWSGNYSALAPRLLKQTVATFAPQFNNSYQHDSQEFCQFLMDGLHEDCNRVKTKPYVEELEGFGLEDEKVAIETWRKHLLRHDSIVVDQCQGMHRSHLTCPVCSRESIKFDVFSTISVPITQDKEGAVLNLEDCIEKFMEGEQLDEVNAWYCPNCKKHVCALKMIAIWSVPDVLVLHLKRFMFELDPATNQVIRSKLDNKVQFGIDNLDISKYVLGPIDPAAPPVYRLFGVSEHSGVTANSGHYTATVRNSKDSKWYRYNDAHVGETSGDAAVTGGAYVLFYQRVKGTSRWSGMEREMQKRDVNPYGGLETDQDGFTKVKPKGRKKGK